MKIILIDDDSMVREPLVDWLKRLNHHVIEAANRKDAILAFVANSDADVVITDLEMEETDSGLEVLRHVSSVSRSARLCLISGTLTDEVIREAKSLGAVVLGKPFEFSELLQKLEV